LELLNIRSLKMLLVEFKNFTKTYTKEIVLDNISFSVEKGKILGIIGPNGVGKSTTLALMTGLTKPSEGNIYYNDKKSFNKILGFVPQDNALYESLSGYDNLSFYFDMLDIKGNKKEKISEIGEYLNIEKDLSKKVSQYSGGMKRKLDIAAALMNNPEILIMDEPTAGLDILTRNSIINLLKKINREEKTIVFTSHYISEMEDICDKIIFLKEKKIAFSGRKEDLTNYYKDFDRLEDLYIYLYNE